MIMNSFLSTDTMFGIAMKIDDEIRESTALIQDVDIPYTDSAIHEFIEFMDEKLRIYPLWLCPVKVKYFRKISCNSFRT
jgi:hypothetical protein